MKYFSMTTVREILIWIGGIPTLISMSIFGIMVFFTAKNKAFSYKGYKRLSSKCKQLTLKEDQLRTKVQNAPFFVQFFYRKWIGEVNYHYLINKG